MPYLCIYLLKRRLERQVERMDRRKVVPRMKRAYRNMYAPQPDIYRGPATPCFQPGGRYEDWIPNDFTFIKDRDGNWHSFGITHPRPDGFIDDFNCGPNGHEAEFQLFHAVYEGTLEELAGSGNMRDVEKVLYPAQRIPGEKLECWAPCVVEKDGLYYMFYSPSPMRLAVSEDLYNWEPKGIVFEGAWNMRDPYIFYEDGIYTMVYVADDLYCRTSKDLITWSEEMIFQKNVYPGSAQESPCLIKRGGLYYLLWCICDGKNGWYDNRTFVFVADSLRGFDGLAPAAMLPGHAPEIIAENGKDYIVSVFYPENGLNIAGIEWKEI